MLLNALVLVEEAVVNPLSVRGCGASDAEKNRLVEEKMLEIAGILGIAVEDRTEGRIE